MKKTIVSLVLANLLIIAGFSQQLERPKQQVSLISEIVSQLNKATGWTLQNNGAWISAENKLPFKEYSLNEINKGRYTLGIENFTTIEVRQVIILDQIYSILIIKYTDGNYEFPILEQNWTSYEALRYYVFNQNRWNKVLPIVPVFNKPYAVNMNLLCSGTMSQYNEKTYLFDIENQVKKAIFQKEESISNLIFAMYPIEISGNKLIRFKLYETLNKKELFTKYLLSYNWEKLFRSFYYEIEFDEFKNFTNDILVIDPKRLADKNYYLTFLKNGIEQFNKENYITSSQSFSKALFVHPPDTGTSSCFLWRGKSYLNLKLYENAKTDFDSVLNRKPLTRSDSLNCVEALFLRGNTNNALYEYSSACKDWQKAYDQGYKDAYKSIKKNCGKQGDSSDVAINPEKSAKYFDQALKKFEDRKYLKSLFLFESAWKYNPSHNDFRIPYYIGVCRYNTEDFARSVDDFEKACKMVPDENSKGFDLWLDAFVMKGKAWQKINNQAQACLDWQIAYQKGSSEALELLNMYCSFYQENTLQHETKKQQNQDFLQGVALYENGEFAQSIDSFTRALARNSEEENLLIYSYRANARHKMQDYQGAVDDFNKAIENRPVNQKYFLDWLRAWFNRGVSKYYLSDFTGACSDWRQAIEMGLEDIEALYYLNNYCGE